MARPPDELRWHARQTSCDGTPIADAWISARPQGAMLSLTTATTLTDAQGRFEAVTLPRGEYEVRVESLQGSVVTELRSGGPGQVRLAQEVSVLRQGIV